MKRAKKLRQPTKPRNPVARALVSKRSGPHGKTRKAQRKAHKDALRKQALDEG